MVEFLIAEMLEPEKETDNTIQIETLLSQNPSMLAKWDDFR